ncbi:hypothetical protein Ancab_014250 [Ancistrocladus abbreviatus]
MDGSGNNIVLEAWWRLGLSFCAGFGLLQYFSFCVLRVWAIVFGFFVVADVAGCAYVPVRKMQLLMDLC